MLKLVPMVSQLIISPLLISRVGEIAKILTNLNLKKNHPDVLYIADGEKLGIEQARKIKDFLSYKPALGKGKVVAIETADKMTEEAQNALLKTIEESPAASLIVLGAVSTAHFLPTILSRCQVISIEPSAVSSQLSDYAKDIERLLTARVENRFEYIEKLKDREEFLHSLVSYFHQTLTGHPRRGTTQRGGHLNFIKELIQAEQWANQNVNIRGILEYLMLVMPSGL